MKPKRQKRKIFYAIMVEEFAYRKFNARKKKDNLTSTLLLDGFLEGKKLSTS